MTCKQLLAADRSQDHAIRTSVAAGEAGHRPVKVTCTDMQGIHGHSEALWSQLHALDQEDGGGLDHGGGEGVMVIRMWHM